MTEHSAQPIHSLIVLAYFVPHSALIAKDFLSTQLASSLFMGEVSTASDLSSYYFIWKTRTIKNDSSQLSNYLSTSKLTRTPILSSFSTMSEKAVSYLMPKTKPSVYIFKFLSLLILVSFVSSCLCQLLPGSFLRQLLFSLYMLSLNDIYAYHFNYLLCADDFLIPISSLVHLFKTSQKIQTGCPKLNPFSLQYASPQGISNTLTLVAQLRNMGINIDSFLYLHI